MTRSSTGLDNIVAIASEAGIDAIEAVYATRCYLTRHGRGPMDDERAIGRWFDVEDATNRPNPWQETLRFGLLDPVRLATRIAADLAIAEARIAVCPSLAISCLDQARGDFAWRDGAVVRTGSFRELVLALQGATGLPVCAEFRSKANAAEPLAA